MTLFPSSLVNGFNAREATDSVTKTLDALREEVLGKVQPKSQPVYTPSNDVQPVQRTQIVQPPEPAQPEPQTTTPDIPTVQLPSASEIISGPSQSADRAGTPDDSNAPGSVGGSGTSTPDNAGAYAPTDLAASPLTPPQLPSAEQITGIKTEPAPQPTTTIGAQPITGTESVPSGAPAPVQRGPQDIEGYIRQAAARRGIDPNVAVAVAQSEGGLSDPVRQSDYVNPKTGRREESYGPFQLYMGGGLGNAFQQATGKSPSDPSAWKMGVDFALDQAAKNGWGAWYGAARVGIGPSQGLERAQPVGIEAGVADAGRGPQGTDVASMPPAGQSTSQSFSELTPNQFTAGTTLSSEDANAACGPAAAIAFARRNGRNPTLDEAVALAKQVGWSPSQGMAGPQSEVNLLNKMGIAATLTGVNEKKIADDVQRGNPVILDTPGHYFVAEQYDPNTGKFNFGNSAGILKAAAHQTWFTLQEAANLGMGAFRAAIHMDNPESPSPSVVAGSSGQEPQPERTPALVQAVDRATDAPPPDPRDPMTDQWSELATSFGQAADRIKGVPVAQALRSGNTMAMEDISGQGTVQAGNSAATGDSQSGAYGSPAVPGGGEGSAAFGPPPRDIRGDYAPAPVEPGDYSVPQTAPTPPGAQPGGAVEPVGPAVSPAAGAPASSGEPSDPWSRVGHAIKDALSGIMNLGGKPDMQQAAQDIQQRSQATAAPGEPSLADVAQGASDVMQRGAESQSIGGKAISAAEQGIGNLAAGAQDSYDTFTRLNARQLQGETLSPEEEQQMARSAVNVVGNIDGLQSVGDTVKGVIGPARGLPRVGQAPAAGIVSQADQGITDAGRATDRYYHGTGSDFARPEAGKMDPNGLFGPGYYLSDDPRVTGSYADMRSNLDVTAADVDRFKAALQRPGLDPALRQQYERAIQQFEAPTSGPNVRPVDVPRDLRLLDADNTAPPQEIVKRLVRNPEARQLIRDNYDEWVDTLPKMHPDDWKKFYPTYGSLIDDLRNPVPDILGPLNKTLHDMGYDGIRYAGGKRIPMMDEAGNAIEHNAVVIFPESLDKIRNATAGTPGGFLPAPGSAGAAVARGAIGGAVSGGYEASQQPGAGPLDVARGALAGGAEGAVLSGARRLVGPRAAGTIARAVRATDEVRQSGSPELQRLADSMDEAAAPPAGPGERPGMSTWERVRQTLVRHFTDSEVNLTDIQKDIATKAGRDLPVEEQIAAVQRLSPNSQMEMQVQREIMDPLREIGTDRPNASMILTLKQNIDQAREMGVRHGEDVGARRMFSGGLTAADSEKALGDLQKVLGPERYADAERVATAVTDFNQGTLKMAEDGGLIPHDVAAEWRSQYPNYTPTNVIKYTEMNGPDGLPAGKRFSLSDPGFRKLTIEGTTSAKQDPIAASVAARYDMIQRVNRNKVANMFIDTAQQDPELAKHVREVTGAPDKLEAGQALIHAFDDQAVKHTYLVDDWARPYVFSASTGEANAYQKFLQTWKESVTGRSVSFSERNMPRDARQGLNYLITMRGGPTPGNVIAAADDLIKGYRDAFSGLTQGKYSGSTADYLAAGGFGGRGAWGGGLEKEAASVDAIARTGGVKINNPVDLYKWVTNPLAAVNSREELGPRSAIFRLAKEQGLSDVAAVIKANDYMPYEVAGDWARTANRYIPFLTARIAGVQSQVRLAQQRPGAYFGTVLATTTAPAIAAQMWNRSDPERSKAYDDVPPYLKYLGDVVMLPWAGKDYLGGKLPNYLFIPSGAVGPFSWLGHGIGDALMGKGAQPQDYKEMLDALVQNMSPVDVQAGSAISQFAGPVGSAAIGLWANKDPFRGSAVATKQNDIEASRLSQAIAGGVNAVVQRVPLIGQGINVHPSQIDYAARQLGGYPGQQVLGASDIGRTQPGEASNIQDIPGVGGLITPIVGNRTGGQFTRETDSLMGGPAGREILDSGVAWRPTPVDSVVGAVPLTRTEHGEVQQDTNRIFNGYAENIRTLAKGWDSYDKSVKEEVFKNLYAAARAQAEGELVKRYPERFTTEPATRRVLIDQERKAG